MPLESLGAVSYSPSIVTMAVYVAVCGISVKEWCDLEHRVRVRSRSMEMAPFDRLRTSSYSPSIVTMVISCIVCDSDLLVENRETFIHHLYFRRNFVKVFDIGKFRMIGLPYGEKKYDIMLSRFHLIPERNGRTDGWTDRIAISISRVSVLTRDKNDLGQWSCAPRQKHFGPEPPPSLKPR